MVFKFFKMFTVVSKTISPTQPKKALPQKFCEPEKKKRCKNNHNIQKIIKHVYVSDFGSARCKKTLKNENIKWILDLKESRKKTDLLASSSSSYSKVENTRRLGNFRYKHISAKDEPDYPIENHFETAIEFITFAVEREENVLVHCNMGVSRSVSVVIAFLMYHQRISYKHAKRVVCLKRSESRPNSGFEKQLKNFKDRRVSISSYSSRSSSPSSSDSDSRSNSS